MLSLILSLWIAQAAPVLPLGTELAPEPAISQQVTACCCGEKCECGADCQCQKAEDGKACCADGCRSCGKDNAKAGCCGEAKSHACCAGHDHKSGGEPKAAKCCGKDSHCKHAAKAGS
jgi:hypothetical protein